MIQLRFTSREVAEDTPARPTWAVVSISDPNSRPVDLRPGWYNVLWVQFKDIDMDKLMNPFLRADVAKRYVLFSDAMADQVTCYVDRMVAFGVEGILVHCEAGISRSAAVAKWIAERHGLPSLEPVVKLHNRYVYRLLKESEARPY